jgi:glycosyltransferase involved in cell wall biosynthesis
MTMGIDASRAFQKQKTGIEEYSYQVIKNLRDYLQNEQVILYLNPAINSKPDFDLPAGWEVKYLRSPFFWTQARLSLEMIFHPVDVLFIPAHTIPLIHPQKTFVTVHGLEYEYCPEAYSFWQRFYMRRVIKNSCRWAKKIIAVSENTKKDLMKLYRIPKEKIDVIYEGYSNDNFKLNLNDKISNYKFLLFVGRLEARKNIIGIIRAFEILKDKYKILHKLVLAGRFGYGKEKIEGKIKNCKHKDDIIFPGYISDEEKFELLKNADVFLFPTFYEGFGLPILEAQDAGVPVVTSNVSSMPEISGNGAVLVDPNKPLEIAEAVRKLLSDKNFRDDIIEKGHSNEKRFSWESCAKGIAQILTVKKTNERI